MKVYKIRRKSDGLYSEGGAGSRPGFSKIGKTWNYVRHAVMHMRSVEERNKYWDRTAISPYTGTCEIIEFELIERGSVTPTPKVFKKGH